MRRALILKPLLKMVMKMIQMENPAVMKNLRDLWHHYAKLLSGKMLQSTRYVVQACDL